MAVPTLMRELQAILANYDHEIDEPESVRFIATVREQGIIDDEEWQHVLVWLGNAMAFLKERPRDKGGEIMIDADPRDADWIRIVRAWRLAGYRMSPWASLWLWWPGHDREAGTYWKQIGAIAKAMKFPLFRELRM